MIATVPGFVDYFDGVRRRTRDLFGAIPADRVDWAPRAGEYSCGDIVRHVAATETMFVGAVVDGRWHYPGHDRDGAPTLAAALARLDAAHAEAGARLRGLADGTLGEPRPALEPGARPVRAWRLLLAMVEHEVHHRSQLASYLTWMGLEAPDIFGLGVEDVERLTAHAVGRS
ncbi:MAG TPA: DinB family protein [Candidatus Acidoferrum sp.]|jgi:uncharacterized damage-inducible protein DinB|nr:DinB family protein [Candidatus Acidoferrum sp.]